MPLHCLLLTRDDQVIRVLRRVFDELEVAIDVRTGADQAAEDLEQRKYDAVMIDCDDVHNAITLLCSVRMMASNKTSTVFAIVNGITTVTSAIELGATLALEKPITESKARHAFRAVHGLMLQERRRYYRHAIDTEVTLRFEDKDQNTSPEMVATVVNISEGGMAIKAESALPSGPRTVLMKFVLPGSNDSIELTGTIAWADEEGIAGVRFENVSVTLRDRLGKFLKEIDKKEKAAAKDPKKD
jgi:DNA-binding NarL/FixJ family response regulator